jgi:hypothetical protein
MKSQFIGGWSRSMNVQLCGFIAAPGAVGSIFRQPEYAANPWWRVQRTAPRRIAFRVSRLTQNGEGANHDTRGYRSTH